MNVLNSGKYFDLIVYGPQHIQGNSAATYEYCNMYIYVVQGQMIGNLDFGFLTEFGARLSMILSDSFMGFLNDYMTMFSEENLDWYLLGLRWGILWKEIFDVKLE
jgi:hypothetical protein